LKLDLKKLERQKLCFKAWLDGLKQPVPCLIGEETVGVKAGIIEAATGFGKTFVAIMTIKDMNERKPERNTIVVVPTTNLHNDWIRTKQVFNEKGELVLDYGHIVKHGLSNVRVFVVNTYTRYINYECDLLILDEAHHYAGVDAEQFNKVITITKYRFGQGLSATLNDSQKAFFAKLGWKIVDTVSPEECEREGYTSTSITYNLGIPLSPKDKEFNEEINESFRSIFKKFDHEFELMRACNVGAMVPVTVKYSNGTFLGKKTGKEWRLWFARQRGYDGTSNHPYHPDNISKFAALGMYYMRKRKDKWQNMPSKLVYVEQIVQKFSSMKTLIFSETGDFADKIAALFPETCLPYHSKLLTLAIKGDQIVQSPSREQQKALRQEGFVIKGKERRKKEALETFIDPKSKINQISAVRALDEGTDVPKVEVILQTAYSSTKRQDTQRGGRGKRIDYENLMKKALIVNLYMKDTQEEKWLRQKQKGSKMIRWVDSVDSIAINHKISLYAEALTEVPDLEAGIDGGDSGNGSSPATSGV
jgi:superfamily II DNA or RNA helicase